jgi:ribosome maturation factor RimP
MALAFLTSSRLLGSAPQGAGSRSAWHLDKWIRMANIAALIALIEPEVKALGYDLVRVKMTGGAGDPTLQVMAERPETRQLDIDDCAAISRRLSDLLDEADPIEDAYRLEVSSPGIDRPLTRLRDFADWAGHEARVSVIEAIEGRKQFKALLGGVDGDVVHLNDPKSGDVAIAFDNIHSAKLVLTDALIAATMPLSPEGADEIDTEGQD